MTDPARRLREKQRRSCAILVWLAIASIGTASIVPVLHSQSAEVPA